MPRSGAQAQERLKLAALELYLEHGYDRTTTAQIAARAGVTERTYFRHFPDKREVLFGGEALISSLLVNSITDAAPSLGPWQTMRRAALSLADTLEAGRDYALSRYHLIEATPALRERELSKSAAIAAAAADALHRRGTPARQASLIAQAALAALNAGTISYYESPSPGVAAAIDDAFTDLGLIGEDTA